MLAGHARTDHGDVRPGGGCLVHETSVEDDEDAVGQFEQLVQVLAHQEHRSARVAGGEDAVVDLRHRGEVEPEHRVRRDEHRGLPRQLTGQHRPLHIAPGQRGDERLRPPRLDPELADPALRLHAEGAA